MDDSVVRALAKWPDVPSVFGWLRLDRRGQWRLKNEIVRHAGLAAFLGRNYAHDAQGRWFVQNGPQRVFVALDYTPWVLRIGANSELETHTGLPVISVKTAMLDEHGSLLLESEHGIGVVTDRDLTKILEAVHDSAGGRASEADLLDAMVNSNSSLILRWGDSRLSLKAIASNALEKRYRFCRNPAPTAPDQSA